MPISIQITAHASVDWAGSRSKPHLVHGYNLFLSLLQASKYSVYIRIVVTAFAGFS